MSHTALYKIGPTANSHGTSMSEQPRHTPPAQYSVRPVHRQRLARNP